MSWYIISGRSFFVGFLWKCLPPRYQAKVKGIDREVKGKGGKVKERGGKI